MNKSCCVTIEPLVQLLPGWFILTSNKIKKKSNPNLKQKSWINASKKQREKLLDLIRSVWRRQGRRHGWQSARSSLESGAQRRRAHRDHRPGHCRPHKNTRLQLLIRQGVAQTQVSRKLHRTAQGKQVGHCEHATNQRDPPAIPRGTYLS